MSEETQMPLATHAPIEETTVVTGKPETPKEEALVIEDGVTPVEEPVVEEAKEPKPEVPAEALLPEPAEQVAAFTPQAPVPKDGQAPIQRQTAFTSQTIVKGSEEAAKMHQTPVEQLQQFPFHGNSLPQQTSAQPGLPVTDLKSAILQSLNPKSFFPITHILRRYFGARFATQEAAKEARVLLEQLHNSRQIVVNNNRHVQLARPFYTAASPMTQYHTLDKTPLEAMLGVGVAS